MDSELFIQIKKLIIVVVVFQLALFLGILVYKLMKRMREIKGQRDLLRRLADHFGGRFDPGGKLGYPKTTIAHEGFECVTYFRPRSRYKKACTLVEAGVPGAGELEFYIYTKSMLSDVAKVLGMQDAEIGQHVFDQKFIIKTNKPLLIKEYLHQDLCRQVLGLPMRDVSLRFEKGRFQLIVGQMLVTDRDYQRLVEVARQLVAELSKKA